MFVRYESKPRSHINSKIQQEYDIDTSDSQMLVTYIEQSMNQMYSTFEDTFPVIDNSRDTYCKRLTSLFIMIVKTPTKHEKRPINFVKFIFSLKKK